MITDDFNEKCYACIITYNPDLIRLGENIESIVNQVKKILIVDNGSNNIEQIILSLEKYEKIFLYRLNENKGIAFALNYATEKCISEGIHYLLTLDQDSICNVNLINEYSKYIDDSIGQYGCIVEDRNIGQLSSCDKLKEVNWMITSGTLINVDVWKMIGGFDDRLFIDLVDTDYGYTCVENGYKNVIIPFVGLYHEIGNSKKTSSSFGSKHPIYNHNAFRKYYIARNRIIVARKHKNISVVKELFKAIIRILYEFIFEREKIKKFKASIKGLHDGIHFKL